MSRPADDFLTPADLTTSTQHDREIAVLMNTDARLRDQGARLIVSSPRTTAAKVLRAAGAAGLLG